MFVFLKLSIFLKKTLTVLNITFVVMAPLVRKYRFESFEETIAFISKVSKIFSRYNHHPKIINFYNSVAFHYFTTDANNEVTDLDRQIADEVESVYKSFGSKS